MPKTKNRTRKKRKVNAVAIDRHAEEKDPRKALAAIEEVGRRLRAGEKVV